MAKFSRVHGGQTTTVRAELRAPCAADQPSRWRVRRGNARCRFWSATWLALLVFAAAGARAQQAPTAPIGDIYESGGGGPVYSDTYESDCESRNNTNIWKGMNPLLCHGVEGETLPSGGSCGQLGHGLIPWKQLGNQCLYCQPNDPPLTNSIIIPWDDIGPAENQGFKCGGDFADVCMVICSGNGKFKPPPGTTQQPTQPPLMGKVPQESIFGGPMDTSPPPPGQCPKPNPNGPKLSPAQVSALTKDVAAAKAMVAKAKTYTDKNPWDSGTQAISKKWFGNATPATQQSVRQDVNNVFKLLNGIKSVTNTMYLTGDDPISPLENDKACYAYVRPGFGSEIYLCDPFWSLPATGPDSQPPGLIHELSHLPQGANTVDIAYGQTNCKDLVYETSDWVGQTFWAPWYKMPQTGASAANPLTNADSFKYFVYYVANQK